MGARFRQTGAGLFPEDVLLNVLLPFLVPKAVVLKAALEHRPPKCLQRSNAAGTGIVQTKRLAKSRGPRKPNMLQRKPTSAVSQPQISTAMQMYPMYQTPFIQQPWPWPPPQLSRQDERV